MLHAAGTSVYDVEVNKPDFPIPAGVQFCTFDSGLLSFLLSAVSEPQVLTP